MRKTLFIVGVIMLLLSGHQVFATTNPCEAGGILSYDQAVDAIASGELRIDRNPDLSANIVTVTVTNNTKCSVPVSLGSYKMFGPYSLSTQSTQEFFAGSATVNVVASAVETLSVNLPTCASQYDIWYGDVLHILIDNQPYGNLLAGDQVNQSNFCTVPVVVQPIVASLTTDSICVVPGTNINFTSIVSGDNVTSKTLEKDTNSDNSYGQVVSWGSGPGTNTFTSAEASTYSGVYSIKLMVNGVEMARRDVTVNTSCGPIIVVPVPITASLTANSLCVVPGTNINFTANVAGDGITSKTLEKDTNSDSAFSQVASFGAGPGTNTFTSAEAASYSGIYTLRLMVNGVERGRQNVTVNTSCGPVVPPPPPITHIIKHVINDNGGTRTSSQFNIHLKSSGIDVTGSPAVGTEFPGTSYPLAPGTFVVSEDTVSGYTSSFSGDCDASGVITISPTDSNDKTCTITNNDIAPPPPPVLAATLHIIKVVINDSVGIASPSAFNIFVKNAGIDVSGSPAAGTSSPGTLYTLVGGTYVVSEDTNVSYTQSFSGDCDANGVVSLSAGQNKICTITNNDIAPPPITTATLHIIKVVINDNNGTATPSTFNMHVKTSGIDVSGSPTFGTSSPGTLYTLASSTYAVSEDANAFYTQSFSGDCDANGAISLSAGENKTCTITNNDIAPAVVVVNVVATTTSVVLAAVVTQSSGGGGGTSGPCRGFNCPVAGTVTLATEYIPSFPNAGLSPRWESLLWSITIMAGVLLSVMISINAILKKRSD